MVKSRDSEGLAGSKGTEDGSDGNGISRRTLLGGAALVVGVGGTLASTSAMAKTAQADAKYQTSPKGSSKCGVCAQFEAPSSCKLVDGTISPDGWCLLFTPKAG